MIDVDAVKLGAEISVDAEQMPRVIAPGVDFRGRKRFGQVKLAGAKGALLGVTTFTGVKMNFL